MSHEKSKEREMIDAVDSTLALSRDVPFGEDPVTGIDVRNLGPENRKRFGIPQYGDGKDPLAVYPAEGEDTEKLYVRTMKTGGLNSGTSLRAYVGRERTGRREGQYVQVTTDYDTKDVPDEEHARGSKTNVTVWNADGKIIRDKDHQSDSAGLSPLVIKIVTHGIDEQIQKVKDGKKRPVQ